MLEGIIIKPVKRFFDERGFFTELMRTDWKDLFAEDKIMQANLSITHPGIIRAWHKHLRGQTDYFIALQGTIKICAYSEEKQELTEIISTGQNIQITRIPGHYWHGFKSVGSNPAILLYFTTKLYDYSNPDEERKNWNDKTIIPKSINGNKDDSRVDKPWDWNTPPHK